MKNLLLISGLVFFLTSFHFFENNPVSNDKPDSGNAILIDSKGGKVILKTYNGCGVGNLMIPSTGNADKGIPPLLGGLSDGSYDYVYDVLTAVTGSHIKGVAFKRLPWVENYIVIDSQEPYVVITDEGMFSYMLQMNSTPGNSYLYKTDSVFISGILKMAKQITVDETNPIVLLTEDAEDIFRIRFFSYPDLQEQFNIPFHFEPEIFEVDGNALFISGWDTSGNYMLYHYSAIQGTLLANYILNASASNAQEFLGIGNSLFLLSSPGDSVTLLSTLNKTDSILLQAVIYPKSGARATYNVYQNKKYFTFQPVSDFPDAILDKQIMVLNPVTIQTDTLLINLSLDQFQYPGDIYSGFGYFSVSWIGSKWVDGISDSVFIAGYGSVDIIVQTGAIPNYINVTYGCWGGVTKDETERIKFTAYPNPASAETIISLKGLEKGKEYILYITGNSGRVHYTTYIKAYQEIELPIKMLSKGVYYLNLDTGKNIITQKLVVQ